MRVDRRYFNDLNELIRNNKLNIGVADIDGFLGKTLYLKRLQKENYFDSLGDMVDDLRRRKVIVRGKYVEFI